LLFGIAVSVATGLLFGLAPARQLSRSAVSEALKDTPRGGTSGTHRRLRAAIVMAEIALSFVLLVAAALTVRSFARLQHVPTGFDPSGVQTVRIAPSTTRYRTQGERARFWDRTLQALRTLPGVEVAAVSRLPMTPGNSGRGLSIPGIPADVPTTVDYRTVSPDYFRLMRIPLVAGRTFTDADRDGGPRVAIVSQSTADRYWPGVDPIGRTFTTNEAECTIVGIVGDIRAFALAESPRPMLYVPFRQDAFPFMTFVFRGRVDHAAVRQAIWSVDSDQAVGALRSVDEEIANSLARRRFSVTLLTAFGGVAVLLAGVGLYGVLAFLVTQRQREIGVRIALGATRRDVLRTVFGEGVRLTAVGMLAGFGLALAATRAMATLLFAISPTDAASFAGAATLLAGIAAAATAIPALRATRVDPIVALRDE